jgi:spore coat polysaccharide biosynthesis protein SpsF
MGNKRSVIVQARMSSSRFPGKSLELIGNKPLVYYVVKRLELSGLPVIVATSTDASDDLLSDYLEGHNIKVFRGSLLNVLNRYISAAEEFGVEEIVRVTADNPLVDISALKGSLSLFQKHEYVDGIYQDGLIKGAGFELVSLKELKSIKSNNPHHLEHVTAALRENLPKNPRYFKLKVPYYHQFIDKIILTCDYVEDLELLRKIFKASDYSVAITIQDILSFYGENPGVFQINANLHQNQGN